jgi:hypothetical protein
VSRSAWEVDDRSTMPCVVCGGEPDRTVELPSLPDVHLGFASSTLCNVCGTAAVAGDADVLARRAEAGRPDDPEAVPDMLRLVLTAAGHRPPPKPVPPPEFRQPSPEPLSDADAAVWAELEPLVYDGPDDEVLVRGRIEELRNGNRSVTLVHVAGARARLSDEGGQPWLISNGVTIWRWSEGGWIGAPYDGPAWSGRGGELAHHRSRRDVDLFGFGQPTGPIERTEYLGRPAWRFAFAAPAHKPYDMHVVIDAATGLTLEQRFGDSVVIARWTVFVTGERMDPALFQWDRPSTSIEEVRAAQRRQHEADMARRAAWFANHVTDEPLSIAGESIGVLLHRWLVDGSFDASLDGGLDGALARRPRSTAWWRLGWSEVTHRWSDDKWDWALAIWNEDQASRLDASAIAGLVRALGR